MTVIVGRKKALSESPLKASQAVGATLATLGFRGSMPLLHGAMGCTAFAKVYFVRHFREPIPLQTTAIDQVAAVMGGEPNLIEALDTLCEKDAPELISVISTGITEMQGTDLSMILGDFRREHPEFDDRAIVKMNTPDFVGGMEAGFAAAVHAVVDQLVERVSDEERELKRDETVNVLVGSFMTPGDIEAVEELVERFGLRARIVPDISASLSGILCDDDFSPVTIGGTSLEDLRTLHRARATLVFGPSMYGVADSLEERTGVRTVRFANVHSLPRIDELVQSLLELSDMNEVPARVERHRRQLADAMLDTHFMIGTRRVAIGAESDLLLALTELFTSMGAEVVAPVAAAKGPALELMPTAEVKVGDLADLEELSRSGGAELVVGSSHAIGSAKRLGVPLVHAGFPQFEWIGGYQRTWAGYRGTRDSLFELANRFHGLHTGEIAPYVSRLAPERSRERRSA